MTCVARPASRGRYARMTHARANTTVIEGWGGLEVEGWPSPEGFGGLRIGDGGTSI